MLGEVRYGPTWRTLTGDVPGVVVEPGLAGVVAGAFGSPGWVGCWGAWSGTVVGVFGFGAGARGAAFACSAGPLGRRRWRRARMRQGQWPRSGGRRFGEESYSKACVGVAPRMRRIRLWPTRIPGRYDGGVAKATSTAKKYSAERHQDPAAMAKPADGTRVKRTRWVR